MDKMDYRLAIGLIALGSVFGAIAQVLFKVAVSPINIIKLGLGMFLYGLAFLIYLFALRSLPLSVAYPIVALSYVFVALMSWHFLNEPWSVSRTVGSIGLVVCIWLIAR